MTIDVMYVKNTQCTLKLCPSGHLKKKQKPITKSKTLTHVNNGFWRSSPVDSPRFLIFGESTRLLRPEPVVYMCVLIEKPKPALDIKMQ